MASAGHGSEQAWQAQVRLIVDAIPTLAWSARSDGSADFFNQRWLDYTGLSAEQARDWGWTVALHSDDLNGLVDYWRSVLSSGEPGEMEGRLRRFDGVYRWFLFRATPSFDNDGNVVKWFGTNTDIEDRKRAECLLAGENRVLEMTAKGSSLESILEALCRVVEQTASGCYCSVILLDPSGSKVEQVVAPSLPSSYNDRFPGAPVDREQGPCAEAVWRKTQVIVPDVASDTRWDTFGWRTAALAHGLKACWSTTILASNGLVLGTFAIYWREPRSPTDQDQEIIEQITHLAAVAIERKRSEAALQQSESRFRLIVDAIPGFVCSLSAAGEVELLNRQVLEYFGKTTEELKNWATSDAVHPDDLPGVIDAWRHSVETGQPYDLELRQRRADGVYRWFQSRALPARDAESRITGWYMLLTDVDDRKRAEDVLRSNEQSLRLTVESIPGFVSTMSAAGEVEFVSRQVSEYSGKTIEELKNWATSDAIHPDDLPSVIDAWRRAIETGQPVDLEGRRRRADGVYRWFHLRSRPQRDAEGRIVRWYNLATDIDDRKRAEAELEKAFEEIAKSEGELRTIIDAIPQLIIAIAADGKYLSANQAVLEYTGLTNEEVISQSFRDVFHPEDSERLREVRDAAISRGVPFEYERRVRHKDGQYRWLLVQYKPLLDERGEVIRWYATGTDIDDRKRAEDALRASERDLRLIFETIPGFVWTMTAAGEVELVSQQMLEYFGKTPADLKEWSLFVHPDDRSRVTAYWKSTIESGQPYDVDHRLRRADGVYRWFRGRGLPVRDTEGHVIRWYNLLTDIDERRQAEEKLRRSETYLAEAQRLSLTGSFGCNVSTGEMIWSEETFRIFEYDQETKPAVERILQRVHPEDKAMVQEQIDRATREGKDCDLEYRLLLPDDSVKHVHVVARALRDEAASIEFTGAVMDVTTQRQARAELEKAFEEIKRLKDRLHDENVALREEINQVFMFEEIVGSSPALKTVLSGIVKVAPTDSTVLITGETGTGKELIARAIHKGSQRAGQAFITVNCASIPSSLIASELFGHEKGAFTGALQRRQGRFELAHSGTIFLDEIGELPAETQIALLRVLQERQFERVGGSRVIPTDVRIIAATNRDLAAAIAAGTFRADLFYRLNVFPIHVPPLRNRKEDIPMLVEYFVKRYAEKARKQISKIDKSTLKLCQSYPWPGNIRELQNIIERSVILCTGDTFWVDEAWLSSQDAPQESSGPLTQNLQNYEKELIEAALRESNGKVAGPNGAAAKLGIPRSTLGLKIKQLNIKKHAV